MTDLSSQAVERQASPSNAPNTSTKVSANTTHSASNIGTNTNTVTLAGGSGGLIIFLINTYAPSSMRELLVYLAPTLAIVIGMIWKDFVLKQFNKKLAERDRRAADKQLEKELQNAKDYLAKVESDPMATPTHKAEMRNKVEALDLLVVNVRAERVKLICK